MYHGEAEFDEKASVWFLKAIENIKPDEKLGEPFYYVAEYYYQKGNAEKDKNNQDSYYLNAQKYYKQAIEHGYNCSYSLEKIERCLGGKINGAVMEKYGKDLVTYNLSKEKLWERVLKDLQEDFGNVWTELLPNTQTALISGILSYIVFVSFGEEIFQQFDFSSSVSAMTKALEIELGRFFHKEYIKYLKANNVSPTEFEERQRSIVSVKVNNYIYNNENKQKKFRWIILLMWLTKKSRVILSFKLYGW